MVMLRNTWVVTVLFVLMSLIADGVQVRDRDVTWVAPSDDALKANPLASRTDALAGGRKLFHQRCSTCHGEAARGTTKAPDLTQPDVQAQSDGALFWKISGGNSHQGMPAFSFLPEPQRWQLVLHVRAAASSPE
jgi:mono/diheme cytochrome c family protein